MVVRKKTIAGYFPSPTSAPWAVSFKSVMWRQVPKVSQLPFPLLSLRGTGPGPVRMNASTSASLVPLVTKEEHLLWAERVKPHQPHCVTVRKMYSLTHSHNWLTYLVFSLTCLVVKIDRYTVTFLVYSLGWLIYVAISPTWLCYGSAGKAMLSKHTGYVHMLLTVSSPTSPKLCRL